MEHLCATLTVFGLTVNAVLSSPLWLHQARDLDCAEIFSGVQSVVRAARERGMRAQGFDKLHDPKDDITTPTGFRRAVTLVMRLAAGGLLWLAPVCSSWVFMNSSNCRRTAANGYKGNEKYKPVQLGNIMAEATAFLVLLAYRRCCTAAVENPIQSVIFKYKPLQLVAEALQMVRTITYRCAFCDAPYGARMLKGYRFLAIGEWIKWTAERCRCPGRVHKKLVVMRNSGGRRRVTGIKVRLTASGAYPLALGRRIVESWLAQRGQCPEHHQPMQHFPRPASRVASASSSLVPGRPRSWTQPGLTSAPHSSAHSPGANTAGLQHALTREANAALQHTPTTRAWARPLAESRQQVVVIIDSMDKAKFACPRRWQQPPP